MQRREDDSLSARERVLLELARRDKSDVEGTFRAITEAGAVLLGVQRVSLWSLHPPSALRDGLGLDCEDLYLRNEGAHTTSPRLSPRDYPRYFDAINTRRVVSADDARADPRTSEFRISYLEPLGITSMMDVPVWRDRTSLFGILCFEHTGPQRVWQPEEEALAAHLADLASASVEASARAIVEARWALVVDALPQGVLLLDTNGKVVGMNAAARADHDGVLKGLETFADRQAALEPFDAENAHVPRNEWPFLRAMRGEVVRDEIYGVFHRLRQERIFVGVSAARVCAGGRVDGVVTIYSHRTQEVFWHRLKRDMLASLAHELKTPLTIAKAFADLLSSDATLTPDARRKLDAIRRSADRMDRLTQTLLDVSNIMLGRLVLSSVRTDLAALAREVVAGVAVGAPSRVFEVPADTGAFVMADRLRLRQVIRQLVENAVRYSAKERPVEVTLARDGGSWVLSVRDQGIGIAAGLQPHVFELFFRAHAGGPHERGGLGVGLYLAREIARAHGGDLTFTSVEGQGSTFRLRLPAASAPT